MRNTGQKHLSDQPHNEGQRLDTTTKARSASVGTSAGRDQVREDAMCKSLEHAVAAKKNDNLILGQTMFSIGILEDDDLARLNAEQSQSGDIFSSLLVASAIRSRLGELLLQSRCITSHQLEYALEMQRESGAMLGEILVGLGWLEKEELDSTLAAQARLLAA